MKHLYFTLKKYDDLYDPRLDKRFSDCYRIELSSDDDNLFVIFVTNNTSGVIYGEENIKLRIYDKSRFFSSKSIFDLTLNNELFCKKESNNPHAVFGPGYPWRNRLSFSDGLVLTCTENNFHYSFSPEVIEYRMGDREVVCQLIVRRKKKGFMKRIFAPFDYVGEMKYAEQLSTNHLISILQLLVIDHIRSSNN